MKKKNLKNFIGQLFMIKLGKELIDLSQDDYVSLSAGTCIMLLDVVPVSALKLQVKDDGYCSWDILRKYEEKKLKHLVSFLHGQKILYYELDYKTTIEDFYYYFRLVDNKNSFKPTVVQKRKQRKLRFGPVSQRPLAKRSIALLAKKSVTKNKKK